MKRCKHKFAASGPGKRLDSGGRCGKEEGHSGPHRSDQAIANAKSSDHLLERKLAKARWNRENRLPNDCIDCGAACSRRAKRCRSCSNRHESPARRFHARKMTKRNIERKK